MDKLIKPEITNSKIVIVVNSNNFKKDTQTAKKQKTHNVKSYGFL